MLRQQKEQVVEEIRNVVETSNFLTLLGHRGLSVAEFTRLRLDLRQAGGRVRVVKNTLFRRAVDGSDQAFLAEGMAGPIAMVWTTDDPVSVAKALKEFIKEIPKVEVKTGMLSNKALSADDVEKLADMPTLDVARAQFAGLLASVPTKFVRLLQTPMTNFGYLLNARREQLEQA